MGKRFAIVIALAASLALAPRAEAFIYWGYFTAIGRADLDGSNPDPNFIDTTTRLGGVAVDGQHLYWARTPIGGGFPSFIGRANLDGTCVDKTFIGVDDSPQAVAVDGAHVYWTSWDDPGGADAIGRADLDGSNVDQSFIAVADRPSAVAVDGGHIYWGAGGAIGRADLDGSNPDPNFIDLPSGVNSGVAVNATHIFWTLDVGMTADTIGRANLSGTGVNESFITGADTPHGVAVDGAHVYWTNWVYPGSIGRADLDGSNADQNFIPGDGQDGLFFPNALAVDALSTPPPPPPPPNDFTFGEVHKNKRKGTAKLTVNVPAPGGLDLAETKKVEGAYVQAAAEGPVQLPLKPKGKAKRKLNEKGKAKVKAKVTFAPDCGTPNTESKKVKLRKR